MNTGSMWSVLYRSLTATLACADGEPLDQLLLDAGLGDHDDRIPTGIVVHTFARLAERNGDPDFGLHAAERAELGAFEVIDFATRSSVNLGEALERVCRYYRLVNDGGTLELEVAGERASLVHRSDAARTERRQVIEFMLAAIVTRGRRLTGQDWPLDRVLFAHPRPDTIATHARVFAAPLEFDRDRDALVFARRQLEASFVTAQPALATTLDTYVAGLLDRAEPSFHERARRAVATAIRGSEPGLASTARALAIGTRSLQRRLAELGTSHTQLVEEVRKDLALCMLRDDRLAIAEIAFLLGYSEPAAFHRAFKRWCGGTPAEHRRAQPGPPRRKPG